MIADLKSIPSTTSVISNLSSATKGILLPESNNIPSASVVVFPPDWQAVTAQKELEQLKQEMRQLRDHYDHAHHELRNLVGALTSAAEVLNLELGTFKQEHPELVTDAKFVSIGKTSHKMQHSGEEVIKILNAELDYSKLAANKFVLQTSPFEVRWLINDIQKIYSLEAKKKEIELIIEPASSADAIWVKGDANCLKEIVRNLVGNAIKYTHRQGKVSMRLEAAALSTDQVELHIAVSDTGVGMNPEELKGLFKPFSQVTQTPWMNNLNSTSIRGTGLGLANSKRFAELMGGDILVTSEKNKGSTFTVIVRCSAATEQEKLQAQLAIEQQAVVKKFNITRKKILIADDQILNAKIVGKILTHDGHEIVSVKNGKEAIEHWQEAVLKSSPFDIILMDAHMPEVDGLAATKQIRQLEQAQQLKRITIFAFTGSISSESSHELLAAGMDGVLSKPFVRNEFYNLLEPQSVSTKLARKSPEDSATETQLSKSMSIDTENSHSPKLPKKVKADINSWSTYSLFQPAKDSMKITQRQGMEATEAMSISLTTSASTENESHLKNELM